MVESTGLENQQRGDSFVGSNPTLSATNRQKFMNLVIAYIFLAFAVVVGTASNNYAKSAEGFTLIMPSVLSAITIILCMYGLSNVMKTIPMGITYASFAGLCIIATTAVGIVKYNQIPNLYTIIGLTLIIAGVVIVNLFGINE